MPELNLTKDEIQAVGYAVHWLSLRLRQPMEDRDEGEADEVYARWERLREIGLALTVAKSARIEYE